MNEEKSNEKAVKEYYQRKVSLYKRLVEQLEMMMEWNEKNIDKEPEQVRRNLTTVNSILDTIRLISFE